MKYWYKILLFVIYFLGVSTTSIGQSWTIDVDIDLQTTDCFLEDINAASYSFIGTINGSAVNISGSATPSTTQLFLATFSLTGSGGINGTLSMSASGICNGPPPLTGSNIIASRIITILFPDNTDCTTSAFPVTPTPASGLSGLSITVRYNPVSLSINAPSGANCSSQQVTLSTTSTSDVYNWQVSANLTSWISVGTTTSNSITVPFSSIGGYGPTYYARVGRVAACTFSAPSNSFNVDAPPPGAAFSKADVSCYGATDGKAIITVYPGIPAITQFQINGRHESNSTGLDDVQVSSGSSTIISGLKPGKWTFTITNNTTTTTYGACSGNFINALTIGEPPQLNILPAYSSTNVSCNSNDIGAKNDGSVTLNLQNGYAPYSYEYSTDGGSNFLPISPNSSSTLTPTFNSLVKNNYILKAKYTSGSVDCFSNLSSTIAVGEPAELIPSVSSTTDVLCRGKSTGAIDFNIANGNGGYVYSWLGPASFGSGNQDISNLLAGIYNVIVTDVKGCRPDASAYSVSIAEPSVDLIITPSKTSYGGFDMTCLQNDGEISLSLTNQSMPLQSVSWKKNGSSFSPSNPLDATDLSAATYSVMIIDNKGCDATASMSIVQHPGITIATEVTSIYNGYNTTCPLSADGEGKVKSVTNGFGSYSYSWSNGTSNSTVTGLSAGNYTVMVTDGNHCSDSEVLVITSPSAIQPHLQVTSNYNGAQISCPSKSDGRMEAFPLNGFGIANGGNYHFTWSHDALVTTKFAQDLSQGTYKVTVTDDYGCSAEESITISDPLAMDLVLTKKSYNGADLSCYNSADGEIQLTLANGATPYSCTWSDGKSTKNNLGITSGDYTVTVTDANACVQSKSITLINPNQLIVVAQHVNDFNGFDISCNGTSDGVSLATVSGGTGSYSYAWSNVASTANNQGLSAGNYSVTVSDSNGCNVVDNIVLTEPPLLSLNGTIDQPVSCFGLSDGQVSLAGVGGVSPYSYTIDPINFLNWQAEPVFSSLGYGAIEFYVKDSNGCQAAMQKSIPQPDALNLIFNDIIPAACNDPVGSATAVVNGGNGGFAFKWFDEVTNQSLSTVNILQNVTSGVYRLEAVDSKNCSFKDQVAISSIGGATFTVDSIAAVSCFGFNDGSSSIKVVSGITPYSYLWSDGQLSPKASGLSSGKYFITVIDGLGCKTIQEVNIPTPQPLSTQYVKSMPLCTGNCNGQIEILATGGTIPYTYEWAGINKSSALVSGLCANSYEVKILDANGCVLADKIELKDPEPLKISSIVNKPICLGRCDGSISLTGNGGTGIYSFQWENKATTSVNANLCPGDYKVQMMDSNDCIVNDQFTVLPASSLPLDLGTKATLCVGQTKVLDPGSQWVSSSWTSNNGFSNTESKISIKDPGLYYYKGIDAMNCIAMDTFKLENSFDLLKAEFLMPAEAIVGDTLVAIDISWPLPERVEWNYPASFKTITSAAPDILLAQPLEPGVYSLGMKSFLAECRDFREKTIVISTKDKSLPGGRLGYEELIEEFTLFPNPNNGNFQVSVKLAQQTEIVLRVIQFPLGVVKQEYVGRNLSEYNVNFNLEVLPQGVYVLHLNVKGQDHMLRFIKW